MTRMAPIYAAHNCRFSHPLSWTLSLFWRDPMENADWFSPLNAALAPDGIRLIKHRFSESGTSQFLVTSMPDISPCRIVQRVKGRLQHVIRDQRPEAWLRHFAIRSVGKVKREIVQNYVASQLGHHPMADARVQQRVENYQISDPNIDLAQRRQTSHGVFWYVLHIVLVHKERWREIGDAKLQAVRKMIIKASHARGYLLGEAGVLPDHVHLLLGCGFSDAPADVALGFLNNLAFAQGMEAVFQFGGFIGTVGEYDFGALRNQTSPDPGKQDRGGTP